MSIVSIDLMVFLCILVWQIKNRKLEEKPIFLLMQKMKEIINNIINKKKFMLMGQILNFFEPVIKNKYFDRITGIVSLLNPFAMLPQLWSCIALDKIEGVSAPMYVLFAIMQIVFSLVAVKAKNFLMFLSMIVSVLISIAIMVLTLLKT
jgi:uncharacterized protein with PQ loop repeat